MRTDTYTKAILAILAAMLAVIIFKTIISFGGPPKQATNSDRSVSAASSSSPAGISMAAIGPSPKPAAKANRGRHASAASSPVGDCETPKDDQAFDHVGCGRVPVMSPAQAVQVIQDDLDASRAHFGRTTEEATKRAEKQRAEAEQMIQRYGGTTRPSPVTVTATPDDPVPPVTPVPKKQ